MDLIPTNKEEQIVEVEVMGTWGERDCVMLEVVIVKERNIGYSQTSHFRKAGFKTFRSG